jgi:hypothetical protein
VTDLLHDGERGTFEWSKLLQTAGGVRCSDAKLRAAWEAAGRAGVSEALEKLGLPRPEEAQQEQASPSQPAMKPGDVQRMLAEIQRKNRERVDDVLAAAKAAGGGGS